MTSFYILETQYEPNKGAVGMRDEIKFRAWDGNRIIHNIGLVGNTIVFEFVEEEDDDGYIDFDKHYWCSKSVEGVHVMQYTGLKDKDGVEIYEGDIVRFTGLVNTIGEIRYNERLAMFQAVKNNSASWGLYPESYVETEVIGNIHENPELLEVAE